MPRASATLLVCLTVCGLALLTPEAHGKEPPAPQATTVRVGCFNTWLIPIVSKDFAARRARMPSALRAQKLDVLCLQEVWTGREQRALARALKQDFPHMVRGGGGLLILSRHPIVDSAWVPFPHFKGLSLGEQLARKGLLEAVIRTPVGRVRVVTTHLALAFGADNPRSKQLAFLLRRLAKQRDLPLVLAGDLNTLPLDAGRLTADYRAVLRAGLVDCNPPIQLASGLFAAKPPTRVGWPRPVRKSLEGWRPDHILVRSGKALSVAVRAFRLALDERSTALSDHNLLRADLRIQLRPLRKGASR